MKKNIGAYITGADKDTRTQFLDSRMNNYIFWTLHVTPNGDLKFHDNHIVTGGKLNTAVSDPIKTMISDAAKQGVISFYFSIGSADVSDWENIQKILAKGGSEKRNLVDNLQQVVSLGVTGFDFDYEEKITEPAATISEMAELLNTTFGSNITFCTYESQNMWLSALQAIYAKLKKQPVVAYNLMCYDGGRNNNPAEWIKTIQDAKGTGVSDAQAFIQPGLAVATSATDPKMDPSEMTTWLKPYNLQGAWIWNSQEVVRNKPFTISDYAQGIQNAINSQIGYYYWTWSQKEPTPPRNNTVGVAFSGWSDFNKALHDSSNINLKGQIRCIAFGGGNINGHWTANALNKIQNNISSRWFKDDYDGIVFDVEEGEKGLASKFCEVFRIARAHGLIVFVTVSHSAPYGFTDGAALMRNFLADKSIFAISPQLYTTGNETENDYSTSLGVEWSEYQQAKSIITPSIVSSNLYPDAQTHFQKFGIDLSGYIRWSQTLA